MKLGYVCTNFNNSADTIAAAESLLTCRGHEVAIVVVDNGSCEHDRKILRRLTAHNPETVVLVEGDNVGYFGGLNVGLATLRSRRPDVCHIVVGNNDLLFSSDFIDSIANCAPVFDRYPVISPDIVTLDGNHQNPHVVKPVSRVREIGYDIYYSNYLLGCMLLRVVRLLRPFSQRGDEVGWNVAGEIVQGHGSCYILGPRFLKEFGLLWAPSFLMGEELFLSKQLSQNGQSVYYEPRIVVRHQYHSSTRHVPVRKMWQYARTAHQLQKSMMDGSDISKNRMHSTTKQVSPRVCKSSPSYRVCTNCVMDTSDPAIQFDANGVCDHCRTFYRKTLPSWPSGETARIGLEKMVSEIRRDGKDRDFDCILGMSGGIDSSYLCYLAKEKLGLRPLVFHVDAGWNSQIAVNNIEKVVDHLGLDLFTEVIDWNEMRDLQLAYLKAGVPQIDAPQDFAFFGTMYRFADKYKIKYTLTGANLSTECIRNPVEWSYYGDTVQFHDIHRRFGTIPLTKFPVTHHILWHKLYLPYIKGVRVLRPLNYMEYIKADAMKLLADKFGWQPYPQKHFESRYTRFVEGYWLPQKFGFDTRRVQYSSLIVTKQMTREDALQRLERPALDEDTIRQDVEYVANKLNITVEELNGYFNAPNKTHRDYKSQEWLFSAGAATMKLLGLEVGGKR